MLLPPAVSARLAGAPGTAEPLPVERDPAAGAPPFRFAARPVRFPRDHEFFEGARVHLSRGRLLPGVCRPGGLPAPLPCDARERLLPLQSCLPLQPLAGGPHPGVARLTLPDPGGEAGHVPVLGCRLPREVQDQPGPEGSHAVSGAEAGLSARTQEDDGDAMEVCSEPTVPSPCRRSYSHRVPSTICFGQGASRGFQSTKKRNKHR
ncbi:zinc finger protein 511 isoform X8 [Castor canadensis]|uniref:Zinc finger protein 511 isoform X8 n=1 Tax=Castor canadensis TaxID=51338 RepID=A0AC58MXH1_CASCN